MTGMQKSASMPQLTQASAISQSTLKSSASTMLHSTGGASTATKKYFGPLQPVFPRSDMAKLPVVYHKGGCDFRCPYDVPSMGKQVLSWPHTKTMGNARFTESQRFKDEMYRSPGPKYSGPSSLGRQGHSKRRSNPSFGFGTSTRNDALKQYAVWSCR